MVRTNVSKEPADVNIISEYRDGVSIKKVGGGVRPGHGVENGAQQNFFPRI